MAVPSVLLSIKFFAAGQEIRNPKLEIRNKSKIQNLKHKLEPFGTVGFGILGLFRISDFEIRISWLFPLYYFPSNSSQQGKKSEIRNSKSETNPKFKISNTNLSRL